MGFVILHEQVHTGRDGVHSWCDLNRKHLFQGSFQVRQKSTSLVAVSEVSAQNTPSFPIHREENVDQAMV